MKEPEPPPPPKRNTWISPALAKQLLRDCQEIDCSKDLGSRRICDSCAEWGEEED